ncbi:hypothetical protein LCGC14_1398150 [marine sediment metagenome]|uniref:Uncharacterized protein n=1 Tax=marine sediment metagenome TaxID=412755 RepID=A0A0F9MZG9_9ZZZZ
MAYSGLGKLEIARPSKPSISSGIDPSARAAIQRAIAYYQPGGGFGKGVEAGLERGRVKAVSAGMQNLVGAGLAGTTMAGGLGMRYEEEVAAPTRLNIEGQRVQAISGIEMTQAGMFQSARESTELRELQLYLAQLQDGSGGGGGEIRSGGVSHIPAYSYGASRTPDVPRKMVSGLGSTTDWGTMRGRNAQRFPAMYDQGTSAPNWM